MARARSRRSAAQPSETTASPDEVARFSVMAESWWDPHGKFKPLHQQNPLRLRFIRDHVTAHFGREGRPERSLADLAVVDVGCGGGLLCEPLRRLGAEVTGIDAAEDNIRVAKFHAEQAGLDIDYRCALPEDLAGEGRRFDVVLVMEVVEHVPDLDLFLEACCRLVRPGGAMVLSTINRTLKSLALAKVGAEYILRWLPPGTHDWRKFVRPSELASGLRRHGVDLVDLKGLSYGPLGGAWFLSGDLDVNYLAFAVRER